jgi:hypothetical protein
MVVTNQARFRLRVIWFEVRQGLIIPEEERSFPQRVGADEYRPRSLVGVQNELKEFGFYGSFKIQQMLNLTLRKNTLPLRGRRTLP